MVIIAINNNNQFSTPTENQPHCERWEPGGGFVDGGGGFFP